MASKLKIIVSSLVSVLIIFSFLVSGFLTLAVESDETDSKKTISWVDFNVPCGAIKKAIALDVASHEKRLNYTLLNFWLIWLLKTAIILVDIKISNSKKLPTN